MELHAGENKVGCGAGPPTPPVEACSFQPLPLYMKKGHGSQSFMFCRCIRVCVVLLPIQGKKKRKKRGSRRAAFDARSSYSTLEILVILRHAFVLWCDAIYCVRWPYVSSREFEGVAFRLGGMLECTV
jgi:hypothetical protein